MTIYWTPTKIHWYKIYEKRDGVKRKIGETAKGVGEFRIPSPKKNSEYFITVMNSAGESLRSNLVVRP